MKQTNLNSESKNGLESFDSRKRKNVNVTLCTLLLMLAFTFQLQAQTTQTKVEGQDQKVIVSGKVTDQSTGEPLVGVNVYVKSTRLGTTTNENGEFTLKNVASLGDLLVFSYIGMERQEVLIDSQENKPIDLAVQLQPQLLLGALETDDQNKPLSNLWWKIKSHF